MLDLWAISVRMCMQSFVALCYVLGFNVASEIGYSI